MNASTVPASKVLEGRHILIYGVKEDKTEFDVSRSLLFFLLHCRFFI